MEKLKSEMKVNSNINENNMSEYEYETFIDNYVKSLKIV